MLEDLSRLLGLEGFAVVGVRERGDELDLELELVAAAACCRCCGRASCEVKERPLVRVRDLPIAGRRTFLVWRKRRFRCRVCGCTFTERHEELPSRQRVTRRFRRRLFERASEGAAHAEVARAEATSRYQVGRAFALGAAVELMAHAAWLPRRLSLDEAHHRRGHELATIVSDPDNRRVVEVLEGRSRRVVERYLRSLPAGKRRAIRACGVQKLDRSANSTFPGSSSQGARTRRRRRSPNRLCNRRSMYKEGLGIPATSGRSAQRCGGSEFLIPPHSQTRTEVTAVITS
jgi:transposase